MKRVLILALLITGVYNSVFANPLFVRDVYQLVYEDKYGGFNYYDVETRGLCIEVSGMLQNFFKKSLGYYTQTSLGKYSFERAYYNTRKKYMGKSITYVDDRNVFRVKYYNPQGTLVASFYYKLTSGDIVCLTTTGGLAPLTLIRDY